MLWKSKKFVFYSVAVVNTHIVIWETIGMEQKEGVKQTLIDGTIRVVARHGPDKTMTRLIATKAGLREMYLYRNFKNKKICSVRLSGLRMPLYQTNSACDTCYDYEAGGLAGERKRLASLKLLRAFHFGEAG